MPNGKRVQRSTREVDRKKAEKKADLFEEATKGERTARQAQRVIADIYQQVTGEHLPSSTPKAYFTSWLARKKPEVAEGTYDFYESKAVAFLEYLGPRADQPITRIDTKVILGYRQVEHERVAGATVNHAIKLLRMIFAQARRDGVISDNPAEDVKVVKKATSTRRPFTLPELFQLLAVADTEWKSLIVCGFYTGARLGDVAKLTWASINLERDELRFLTGKTGRQQIIPIAPPLHDHLVGARAGDDPDQPLHPRAFKIVEEQGKTGSLSVQFTDLMAKAGLVAKRTHKKAKDVQPGGRKRRRQTSAISFHALRHTATSILKNAGVSSAVVQEFIGHDTAEINAHYTHIELGAMREAAKFLPALK